MRGKELLLAASSAILGTTLAVVFARLAQNWPSPVIYYSIIIVGLGVALVVLRYGRLGPFQGELGSPRFEAELRRRFADETERARRYGREFTILTVRQQSRQAINLADCVRSVDHVFRCRRGLAVLLLPETSQAGALAILQRLGHRASSPLSAALVSYPTDGTTGDQLAAALLCHVRKSTLPGMVVMRTRDAVDVQHIAA